METNVNNETSDEYDEDDYEDDMEYIEYEGDDERLFKENPLKAIWIKLQEIKDILDEEIEEDYYDEQDGEEKL